MSMYKDHVESFCFTKDDFNYMSVFNRLYSAVVEPMQKRIAEEDKARTSSASTHDLFNHTALYVDLDRRIDKAIELYRESTSRNISRFEMRKFLFENFHIMKAVDEDAYNNLKKLQKLI